MSEQDLQVFDAGSVRLQVFLGKAVAHGVGPKAGTVETGTTSNPSDQL